MPTPGRVRATRADPRDPLPRRSPAQASTLAVARSQACGARSRRAGRVASGVGSKFGTRKERKQ
eukprot:8284387-Alexandrium_andersonii.AAC.1